MSLQQKVVEDRARGLYEAEYADESDADGWDDAPGWERELFRRRARLDSQEES